MPTRPSGGSGIAVLEEAGTRFPSVLEGSLGLRRTTHREAEPIVQETHVSTGDRGTQVACMLYNNHITLETVEVDVLKRMDSDFTGITGHRPCQTGTAVRPVRPSVA